MTVGQGKVLYLAGGAFSDGRLRAALRSIVEPGSEVVVAVDYYGLVQLGDALDRICREHPHVRYEVVAAEPFDHWAYLGRELSLARLYLDSVSAADTGAGWSAAGDVPLAVAATPGRFLVASRGGRRLLQWFLGACERALPRNSAIDGFISGHSPGLLLIEDLKTQGGSGSVYARSGRALGVRTVVCLDGTAASLFWRDTATSGVARGVSWLPLLRWFLQRVARRCEGTDGVMREKVARAERVRADRVAAALARKADAKNAKQRNEETRLRLQLEGAERLSAERETAARAYEHYLRVRDWAAESSDSGGAVILSPSEQRMREGLRHLWDAAPETIARLRHSCAPLSGDRAADYDPPSIELKQRVRHGINAMRRWAGKDLLVAEPAALGGFGCAVGGERYNTDTVRFFNSLVALRDAAVLGGFEHAPSRQLVWEIGGGWGGFAYQFKRLFPNVTYVISGIPELLLVSSVYLLTLFPDAQIRLHRSRAGDEVWQDWESADFVLAGEHELLGLSPPRLDLTLDVMALARMTPPRRATHVRAAFECGSRYFYSSSAADAGEEASAAVRQAIEPWYWPHPVPPRVDAAAEDEGGYGAALGALEYAHLVGWRRIHA